MSRLSCPESVETWHQEEELEDVIVLLQWVVHSTSKEAVLILGSTIPLPQQLRPILLIPVWEMRLNWMEA